MLLLLITTRLICCSMARVNIGSEPVGGLVSDNNQPELSNSPHAWLLTEYFEGRAAWGRIS